MSSRDLGGRGERAAAQFLLDAGYDLIARNFRTRYGEIDIIARQGDTLVFVEVKTRRSGRAGTGREAVTRRKQDNIITVALQYMQLHGLGDDQNVRFDVVEVGPGGITHIAHAFGAGGPHLTGR